MNVTNGEAIKKEIILLNPVYDYGFINADNVASVEQLNSAIVKTFTNLEYGKGLKTNGLYSELLLNLSPNDNISDSLTRFGISRLLKNMIVVKIGDNLDHEKVLAELKELVDGEFTDFDSSSLVANYKVIKKNYKLGESMVEDLRLSDLLIGIIQLSDYK